MSTDVVVNDKTIPEIFNEVAEKSVLNNTPHEEEPLKDDEYEVINERPPIWDDVVNAGLKFNPNTTIFTYGRAIYNPAGIDIPDDLHVHECVHMDQQAKMAGGPDAWWGRYLTDPWFRLSQEAEAYGAQYRYLAKIHKDRNARARILNNLAHLLAGPTYGNSVSLVGAMDMIRKEAKI
jgi:hypothetical protein